MKFLIPQIDEGEQQDAPFYYQQDGAPPHYLTDAGLSVQDQLRGHLVPPVFDSYGFFLWGFIKDKVYVLPLPASLADLRRRITAGVAEVTPDLVKRVWREIDYRWDVCRITNRSHIDRNKNMTINLK
ncbi:hypothetical protein J6590_027448 [Homalodisca vitripennis]|nr:hypothetical protein J6590_027448 [Homalodisca vitripennis]